MAEPRQRTEATDGDPPATDALAHLLVIDRLEVGPVQLSERRLVAPYRVVQGDEEHTTELSYRWEEDVFAPGEPASLNLAALIAAQVALNYGLFCRQIVFHGPLDKADRRFLTDMAANTAREIYVKKLLEDNPFLVEETADRLAAEEPVKRKSYLAAELLFPDAVDRIVAERPPVDRSRVAVLASGGKDSLLSAGLLAELGHQPHSIFVNESGRHWYTALNAYRRGGAERPDTTCRVWSSCDRVFSWMLRRLPFIRPDFARLRSDEYPIRLWTVAVFSFGALPLVAKRGIGRLVIGDEHDTSRRLHHRGIPHYDGLYDQSRWFDEALTRFYRRKGWPLVQFSLLRSLSELLIQKTLVERYPELQRDQVSCHAAHLDGERALPCGRCEKCRRIVGMLLALGGDPAACGYTPRQIDDSLAALTRAGVHQESAGAEQLAWLLREKGLLAEGEGKPDATGGKAMGDDATGLTKVRRHPEVMQLRFERQASPPEAIPADLRRPLYTLLLQHADGAVQRQGRLWVPCDPLAPELLSRPYPFATPADAEGTGPTGSATAEQGAAQKGAALKGAALKGPALKGAGGGYLLGEMTWPQARQRFRQTDTALLPVGAIEQHGHHLPLDTDSYDADYLCRQVAERLSEPKPLVLPLIPYGVSYHHDDFPGTLSISPETLSRLVYEVGMATARWGIIKLVIVNGHGGNAPTLQYAAQMINRDAHIFTCVDTGETSDADIDQLAETPGDVHAGEIETSTTLAVRPELVDMELATACVPRFSSQYLDFSSQRSVEWYAHTHKISPSGVLGDATRASAEKGEKMWRLMIDHLAAFIEKIKGMSLDEIHERRL